MHALKIKKLSPNSLTPVYGTPGSACFDIYGTRVESQRYISGTRSDVVIGTDLQFEIPEGHVLLVFSRSGQAFKDGTTLTNSVGVIDSDYRGELKIMLTGPTNRLSNIDLKKAIAQGMILPISQVTFEEIDELSETSRGAGGFGSTDKTT